MTKMFLILLVILGLACSNPQKQRMQPKESTETTRVAKLSKLTRLQREAKGKVITHCDLSHDNIRTFPDLSGYTIQSLNLSHNQLDTVIVDYLPKGLIKLDLSYNQLKRLFNMSIDPQYRLSNAERKKRYASYSFRELNVSHNQIKWLSVSFLLNRIIASHNDLRSVSFNHTNIKFLDISYNSHLRCVLLIHKDEWKPFRYNHNFGIKPLFRE